MSPWFWYSCFKKWSTHLQMLIGRMHGLYLWGKTHSLLGKSRDQRWFHHAKSCVHYTATSVNAYWYSHTTHYSKPSRYLLTRVMVRLLTSIRFLFIVLTIAIFKLSVVPLNKSFYHKTIQPIKMSMQTIGTMNPLGGTLKEPMLYLDTYLRSQINRRSLVSKQCKIVPSHLQYCLIAWKPWWLHTLLMR